MTDSLDAWQRITGIPVVVDERVPPEVILMVPSGSTEASLSMGALLRPEDVEMVRLALDVLRERGMDPKRGAVLVLDMEVIRGAMKRLRP